MSRFVQDPGWLADWDFVQNGQNICAPDAAVVRSSLPPSRPSTTLFHRNPRTNTVPFA
jgi:hypothetical protein